MAKKQYNLNNITISATSSGVWSSSGYATIGFSSVKIKYHVLGEDIEFSQNHHVTNATMIATLNVLGKPFLEELHKNNTFFPIEIEEYLEKKFKSIERDKKIDKIIK
jgi:acyl-CoA hydrolase